MAPRARPSHLGHREPVPLDSQGPQGRGIAPEQWLAPHQGMLPTARHRGGPCACTCWAFSPGPRPQVCCGSMRGPGSSPAVPRDSQFPRLGLVSCSCLRGPRDQGGVFRSCPKESQCPWESGACDRCSGLYCSGQPAKERGYRYGLGPSRTASSGPKGPTYTISMGPWGMP